MRLSLYRLHSYWRQLIAVGLLIIASAASPLMYAGTATVAPTILVVGDSLSAEYGLKRGSGWVQLLVNQFKETHFPATVINASISGDTTSGGGARLESLLKKHKPHYVIIELGGNDALRGMPLSTTEDNLNKMTQISKKAGARVLLIGMQVPPNYGREYGDRFSAMFANVARINKVALVPFLLKGVADSPDSVKLFQNDRIHPKEEAHPTMLANVWPELKRIMK
jgi:acyl-CoA thioesterase I